MLTFGNVCICEIILKGSLNKPLFKIDFIKILFLFKCVTEYMLYLCNDFLLTLPHPWRPQVNVSLIRGNQTLRWNIHTGEENQTLCRYQFKLSLVPTIIIHKIRKKY